MSWTRRLRPLGLTARVLAILAMLAAGLASLLVTAVPSEASSVHAWTVPVSTSISELSGLEGMIGGGSPKTATIELVSSAPAATNVTTPVEPNLTARPYSASPAYEGNSISIVTNVGFTVLDVRISTREVTTLSPMSAYVERVSPETSVVNCGSCFYDSLAATGGRYAPPLAAVEGRTTTNTSTYGFTPAPPTWRTSGHQSSVSTTPGTTSIAVITTAPAADTTTFHVVLPASSPTSSAPERVAAMFGANTTVMTTTAAAISAEPASVATIPSPTTGLLVSDYSQLTRAVTPVEPTQSITANSGGAIGYTLVSAFANTSPCGQPA